MKRCYNIKITAKIPPLSKGSKNKLNSMIKHLNKPGQLLTKAHLRRGKWLTISTDVATPEAMKLYINLLIRMEAKNEQV